MARYCWGIYAIMDTNVRVSVVMPVYNAEKFIERTLNSILAQTLREYEIILVNDGSRDGSGDICDRYSKLDERVHTIHQKNSGAAVARNNGLKVAQGEYVIFLDSDDTFAPTMLEEMYENAIHNDADTVICGFNVLDVNRDIVSTYLPCDSVDRKQDSYLLNKSMAPWNKLCRRRFIESSNIHFQNISCCNDVFYSICVLLEAAKIIYIHKPLVQYSSGTEYQISAKRDSRNLGLACFHAMERYNADTEYNARIQIMALCILCMKSEIVKCTDESKNRELHEFIKNNILSDKATEKITDIRIKNIVKVVKSAEYSREFILYINSIEGQLSINKFDIINRLSGYSRIVVWGMGVRGMSFLKFCKNNNIAIYAVTDKRNINIGQKDGFENKIIKTEEALRIADVIVASNNEIYHSLLHENRDVINLQNYLF